MHEERLPGKKDEIREHSGLPERQRRKLGNRINRLQGEQERE